jgi:hypothetical protein
MADEIGVFTPEQARLIWQDYQTRQQLAPQISQNFPQRRLIDEPSPHRVWVRNDSSETIPAYGCMQITGTDEVSGRTVVKVVKPTDTDGEYLINSQFEIPAIGEGESGCGWAHRFGVVVFLGDAPSEPTRYQPIVDSWEVEEGDGPFTIFGEHNAVEGALIGRFAGGGSTAEPPEPNPGVVTVEITGESDCDGESFDDLGYHVFLATITSRPFGSPTEMRKERSGELTIFDPTGCMLDESYDPEDFIGATAFVSLMYGGEIFDETYNFKNEASGENYVLPGDTYETFRPATSCKPFGWLGGNRTGYTASIGPLIPNGNTTFQVELPERGVYEVEITYGDATDATDNLITLSDGDRLLRTMTGTSEGGETWVVKDEYDFKSSNRPLLKINLDNADDRDSRIVKLTIKQIDPPTQWEVINRCCIAEDSA